MLPETLCLQYSALQGIVASFLDQDSASASSEAPAKKALSKGQQAALSRLANSQDEDATTAPLDPPPTHEDAAPATHEDAAPATKPPAAKASHRSKSGDSARSSKVSKRAQPAADDAASSDEHVDGA
jgi:hypothetical protein